MLKLEFQNMSGAQLRHELLQLLGVPATVANYAPTVAACQDKSEPLCPESTLTVETGEGSGECSSESATEPVKGTRKRRTKAQIEADALAEKTAPTEVTASEPEAVEVEEKEPEAEPIKEVKPPEVPKTFDKLTDKIVRTACVNAQDRLNGDGSKVMAVLESYGVKSVADLKESDYKDVFDKVNKLGVEEKTSF